MEAEKQAVYFLQDLKTLVHPSMSSTCQVLLPTVCKTYQATEERARAVRLTRCRGLGTALHSRQNSQKVSKTPKTKFDLIKLVMFSTQLCQKDEGDREREADHCMLVSIHKTLLLNSTSIWLHLETQDQQL